MKIIPTGRVVLVGAGMVGSSVAYSILNQQIAKELVIIDIAEELAKAHVLDMQDAAQFTAGTDIQNGNYNSLEDGDVVVITCGAAQKDGQTRQDLLKINAGIIRSVIKSIRESQKQVFIVMVTNPVDIMTYIAVTESGLPENMVFGSGTFLDTGRLRLAIAEKVDVNTNSIHAYILGEHGDTSFPLLSNATVSGIDLAELLKVDDSLYEDLLTKVIAKAYQIIQGKKASYFGIGNATAVIVKAILRNEKRVLPMSVMLKGEYGFQDVCIGIPVKLSASGYEIIAEVKFNEKERELFEKSVKYIKQHITLIKIN